MRWAGCSDIISLKECDVPRAAAEVYKWEGQLRMDYACQRMTYIGSCLEWVTNSVVTGWRFFATLISSSTESIKAVQTSSHWSPQLICVNGIFLMSYIFCSISSENCLRHGIKCALEYPKNSHFIPKGLGPVTPWEGSWSKIQATCENGSRGGFDNVPCFSFPTLLEGVDFIKLLVCRLGNWFCFALDWGVGSVFSWEFSFPWFYKHTSTFQGAPIKP